MSYTRLNIRSLIAGVLIGLGVIINTLTSIPVLGALLFSFGLLTIIALQLPLYTGKIGFIGKEKGLCLILISNLIGIAFCVALYCIANPGTWILISQAASIKFTKSFLAMFIYGVFCGMLIHFAVKTKEKPYLTSMAVIIFILIGAEHCIAAFPFLLAAFNLTNLIKFIMIILGNSVGAILLEKGLSYE